MKRLFCLSFCVLMLSSCASTYQGATNLRIKADEFKGNFGPLNSASGKNLDLILVRDCTVTGDKDRKIKPSPDTKMTSSGSDSTFEVVK